ncbi:MAG: TlpA family protein disulfide reductase [Bdellovibrionota bacterium]
MVKLIILLSFLVSSSANAEAPSPVAGLPLAGPAATIDAKKDVVLYFWASWCPDCKGTLKSKFEGVDSSKYQFLAINTEKDPGRMENFAKKESLPIPVYHDQDKKLQAKYQIFSVPSWVLLSRNGDTWAVKKSGQGETWKTELK